MHTKVLCLGNAFIAEDSLALRVADHLSKKHPAFSFVNIKDSFELLDHLQSPEPIIILDVVFRLQTVQRLHVSDLTSGSIISAHDFDASFFLQLLGEGKDISIIGIPMRGEVKKIGEDVEKLLKAK